MKKIDLKAAITTKAPDFFDKYPSFVSKLIMAFLNRLLHVEDINRLIKENVDVYGVDMINQIFKKIDFSYSVADSDIDKIPREGRLIAVSNHPLGAMDGLALLKIFRQVRPDAKFVVNDVLMNLENMQELYLPFNLYSPRTQKQYVKNINEHVAKGGAVLFFPAGEVSRTKWGRVIDGTWKRGAIQLATKFASPILPVHIHGKNSPLFYIVSFLHKQFSTFMIPREVFRKNKITVRIGDIIPASTFTDSRISQSMLTRLLKKHVYRIGRGKSGYFKTEEAIIPPVDPGSIIEELKKAELLFKTHDDKQIYIMNLKKYSPTLREIARLREITFRSVGEGTGMCMDTDKYDVFYKHIIVWNAIDQDIMGSYRVGVCRDIMRDQGKEEMYINTMFDLNENFLEIQENGLEMGRSFIQAKYWRSRALDHLWRGIGMYAAQHTHSRYLFGTVSISRAYPDIARGLIASYYQKWYSDGIEYVIPHKKFIISDTLQKEIDKVLSSQTHHEDFKNMRHALKNFGFSLPILYKRYTQVCEYGGVRFLEWSVDEVFGSVVDGLVVLDLHRMKPAMKKRYLDGE